MKKSQYINELDKIIEEGDTLGLDGYLENYSSESIISDFGQILNERVLVKKKFKSGDRVENTIKHLGNFKGKVVQSYLHLDGEHPVSPHIRYVVDWDTGKLEDLSEKEIRTIR
jgi:hypothetical protein